MVKYKEDAGIKGSQMPKAPKKYERLKISRVEVSDAEMLDVILQWLNVWQARNPGAKVVQDADGKYIAVDAG